MALTQVESGGIKDDAVVAAKVADDAVGIAQLSATGTAGNTTFLRGDNSWQVVDTSIADDSIAEVKLDVSNTPTNGQFLQAQSGEGGGLTWAAAGSTDASDLSSGTLPAARIADDSIVEAKLDISNAPSDDSLLQYKNSSDKLTWVPRGHQILQIEEWSGKSWSTHTGDTGWHGNVIDGSAGHAKITPTLATSKIAVWGNMHLQVDSNNASTTICGTAVRVTRKVSGQSDVEVYRYNEYMNFPEDSGMDQIWVANTSFHFVDDPSTTSEIEYFVETSSHHSSATVNIGSADHWKGITMMELAE